jgi:hypothetical protein
VEHQAPIKAFQRAVENLQIFVLVSMALVPPIYGQNLYLLSLLCELARVSQNAPRNDLLEQF